MAVEIKSTTTKIDVSGVTIRGAKVEVVNVKGRGPQGPRGPSGSEEVDPGDLAALFAAS